MTTTTIAVRLASAPNPRVPLVAQRQHDARDQAGETGNDADREREIAGGALEARNAERACERRAERKARHGADAGARDAGQNCDQVDHLRPIIALLGRPPSSVMAGLDPVHHTSFFVFAFVKTWMAGNADKFTQSVQARMTSELSGGLRTELHLPPRAIPAKPSTGATGGAIMSVMEVLLPVFVQVILTFVVAYMLVFHACVLGPLRSAARQENLAARAELARSCRPGRKQLPQPVRIAGPVLCADDLAADHAAGGFHPDDTGLDFRRFARRACLCASHQQRPQLRGAVIRHRRSSSCPSCGACSW